MPARLSRAVALAWPAVLLLFFVFFVCGEVGLAASWLVYPDCDSAAVRASRREGGPPSGAAIEEMGLDEDRDGRYESLFVRLTLPVGRPGRYLLESRLCADDSTSEGEEVVASGLPARTGLLHASAPEMMIDAAESGDVACEIRFDGEEIRRRGRSGPYLVRARLIGPIPGESTEAPEVAVFSARTRPYEVTRFGWKPARILGVEATRVRPTEVELRIRIEVDAPGSYQLIASRAGGGDEAATGVADARLDPGRHEIKVSFADAAADPVDDTRLPDARPAPAGASPYGCILRLADGDQIDQWP